MKFSKLQSLIIKRLENSSHKYRFLDGTTYSGPEAAEEVRKQTDKGKYFEKMEKQVIKIEHAKKKSKNEGIKLKNLLPESVLQEEIRNVDVGELADAVMKHVNNMPFDPHGIFEKIWIKNLMVYGPKSPFGKDNKTSKELLQHGYVTEKGFLTEKGEKLFEELYGFPIRDLFKAVTSYMKGNKGDIKPEIFDFAQEVGLIPYHNEDVSKKQEYFINTHLQNEKHFETKEYSWKKNPFNSYVEGYERIFKSGKGTKTDEHMFNMFRKAFEKNGEEPSDTFAAQLAKRAEERGVDVSDLVKTTFVPI